MLISSSALILLRDLVHIAVCDDVHDGDTFLVADNDFLQIVRDAVSATQGPALKIRTDWALPATGRVFALATSIAEVAAAPAMRAAAAAGRLAFVVWPRAGDDRAAGVLARALGLVPLVMAANETGVCLDHAASFPDSEVHVAVQPALLGRRRASAQGDEAAQKSQYSHATCGSADVEAWLDATHAYLVLGLYRAALAAAARAGACGDVLAQRAQHFADLDNALALALATSHAPLVPVIARGASTGEIPLLQATAGFLGAASFAQQLDDEILGHGVDGLARTFVLLAIGAHGTLLDLSPGQGHLALAVAATVGGTRVVVYDGSTHHALVDGLALLKPPIRPTLAATLEDAVGRAIATGAPELIVHANRGAVDNGMLAAAVRAMRARGSEFLIVFPGPTALFTDVDVDIATITGECLSLNLKLHGAFLQSDGKFGMAPLAELPRPHLVLAC